MRRTGRSGAIVGREAELAALRRFVRALPGGPSALVLTGDVGIGKTTLWNEGVAEARRRSYRVLCCTPAAPEAHYPYAGLGDLLDEVGEEVVATLSGAPRRALEVALLRSEPAGHALEPRAVAAALRGALVRLAEAGPLLVAVDDVQWLDAPSARALSFALRRLGTRPVGVLVGVRVGHGIDVPFGLDRVLDGDRLVRLALGPLEREPLERLLKSALGADLPEAVVARLHESGEGNPFFALELGRAVVRRGHRLGSEEALPVPDSLREVVRERLSALGPPARAALLAASALARPTPALVYAAGGNPSDHGGLADAVEAGVIEIEGDRVRLTHPLLASVAYTDSTADERRRLHGRLAELVDDPEERARHLALAARGPDDQVAAALDEAARRAAARGAPEVAAALAEQAAQFTPVDRAEDVRRRRFEAGDHYFVAGDMLRARELLERVQASAPAGPARARALQRLGEIRAQQVGFPAGEGLFLQALGEAGDESLLRLELHCDLALTRLIAGDIPGGAEWSQAALELTEGLESVPPLSMLRVLVSAALFQFLQGHGVRHDLLDRAMEIEEWAAREAVALRPGYLHLPHIPATILKWSDDLVGARSRYAAAYARTSELGDESWLPWLLYHMAELEAWAGTWVEAAAHGAAAHEAAERTGQLGIRPFTLYAKALVAAYRGDAEAARRDAEEGLAVSEATGAVTAGQLNRSVLGFLALSLGDPRAALTHLRPAREALSAIGLGDPGVVRSVPDEIEALVAVGELESAEALTEGLLAQADAGRPWASAAGARCQALLRAAVGDWDGALAGIERAAAAHERLGQPFERGRTLLVEGAIRRRARQKRAARDALEAALAAFQTLGAPVWAEKVRSELQRIGGRPRAPETLTPTEERVAALVALGWTNKEVATSLFMSVKTVESNLRQVYRKLGVASRRELARLEPVTSPDAEPLNRTNGANPEQT